MTYGYNRSAAWAALVSGATTARNRRCRSLTIRQFRGTLFPRLISRGSIEAVATRPIPAASPNFRG